MKASNSFETAIKTYIEAELKNNKDLALAVQQEDKTLPDCCSYIMGEVKKLKVCAITNDEVFKLANKYYLTKGLKKPDKVSGTVVVGGDSETVEKLNKEYPSEKEITRTTVAKEQVKPKKAKQEKPKDGNQLSLFEELFK